METPLTLLEYDDGDLIGFSGQGLVSDGINLGTYGIPRWHLCHIGIVCTYRDEKYIFESTTTNGDKSCAILGHPTNGVQAHKLDDILARPGKVWKYGLKSPLYDSEKKRLLPYLLSQLGVQYDYFGAGRSGGFLLRAVEGVLRDEDVTKLFCSELCGAALTKVNRARIVNASAENPNSLVRFLYREAVINKRERQK